VEVILAALARRIALDRQGTSRRQLISHNTAPFVRAVGFTEFVLEF
jgi:hypothetical protein